MWTPLPATAPRRSPLSNSPAFGWKTGLAALALGALSAFPATAQIGTYPVTPRTRLVGGGGNLPGILPTSQTWTPLSTVGGSSIVAFANLDDANSAQLTLGFSFPYIGGTFNRIIANTNGFVKLGSAGMAGPRDFVYGAAPQQTTPGGMHASTSPLDVNLVGAFNYDLDGTAVAADVTPTGAQTIGSPTAQYRFFSNADSAIFEWMDVHTYDQRGVYTGTPTFGETQYARLSFQIKLFPSGIVKLVYGPTTSNTAADEEANFAAAGLKGLTTTQILTLVKATANWSLPVGSSSTAGNQLNFRKSVLPTVGLAAGLAREFRLTPDLAVPTADASVIIYTLGQLPTNGGSPHIYRARITNLSNSAYTAGGSGDATLTISAPNAAVLTAAIPVIPVGGSVVVSFPGVTPTVLGAQTATVTIPADANNANNSSAFAQTVTEYSYSYATTAPAAGGVGFNAAGLPNFRGEFVARFTSNTTQLLNQARIDFQGVGALPDGRDPFQVLVFAADGPGGTPGTLLFASDVLLTPTVSSALAGVPTIVPILTAGNTGLTVNGDFFVGVRQVGPNNVGFSYEAESPIRNQTFYSRSNFPTGYTGPASGPFADFQAAGSPFRFSIAADLQDPSSPAVPNCTVLDEPADLATNVQATAAAGGRIVFFSGGGNPTGFDVYLGTVQADVQNNLVSTRVSTNQIGLVYNFTPALAFNTTYYYKIVPLNVSGQAGGPGVSSCTTRSFTTAVGPPVNDNCASATLLTVNPNGSPLTTAGTTAGATEEAIPDPVCQGGQTNDVWYRFNTGTSTSVLFQVTLGTATAIGAQLFGACGSAPVVGSCTTNATTVGYGFSGLAQNTIYRVRLFTSLPAATPGSFTVNATLPPNITLPVPTASGNFAGSFGNVIINSGGTMTLTGNLSATSLTINAGGTLVTNGFIASGNSFILNAGGTLDVGSADGITRLFTPSAFTGAIRFTTVRSYSDDATYRFTGVAPGFTGGGLPAFVRGIETGNTAFVTLTNPITVRQVVRVGTADLSVGSGPAPRLTLLSNATTTAMVYNTGTGNVVGTVRVMRYIGPGPLGFTGVGYRHLASPVAATTINDLNSGTFFVKVNSLYNDTTTRKQLTRTNFPNVFYFDEAVVGSVDRDFVDGYQSPGSTSDVMVNGRGYAVATSPATPPDFYGSLVNGNVLIPVKNSGPYANVTPENPGFNMIGNPYPGPLDWGLVPAASITAAGLTGAAYVHRTIGFSGTNYSTFTNNAGAGQTMAMGQGFFVERTVAGNGTLTLTNVARVSTFTNPVLNRRVETRPLLNLSLVQVGQPAEMGDNTYVYFEQGATANGSDTFYDASKMNPTGVIPTLFTRAGAKRMAINGQPALDGSDVVTPLGVEVTVTGTYTLNADQLVNFPAGTDVLLVDALTGTTQNLRTNPTYSFRATAGDNTPRFTLHFRGNGVTGVNADLALASQLDVYPNPTNGEAVRVVVGGLTAEHTVTVSLINPLGQVVSTKQVAVANAAMSTELNVSKLARGFYTLRVVANGRSATRTVVVK